jgi:hypothetical protein
VLYLIGIALVERFATNRGLWAASGPCKFPYSEGRREGNCFKSDGKMRLGGRPEAGTRCWGVGNRDPNFPRRGAFLSIRRRRTLDGKRLFRVTWPIHDENTKRGSVFVINFYTAEP